MKAKPGAIPVATAGVNSTGHNAMELIAKATGVKYSHVTYDGGNPAVVATVAGETEVTTQLAVEQADMIRGKRLRPLATVERQAARARGLRHDRAADQVAAQLHRAGQLLRHLHSRRAFPTRSSRRSRRSGPSRSQERGDQEVREQPRRAVRAVVGRDRAEGGVAGRAGQRLAALRRRQGQSFAGHGRHPEALTRRRRAMSIRRRRRRRLRHRGAGARRQRAARRPRLDGVRRRRARRSRSRMDRLEAQTSPYTAPGLLPGCSASSIALARRAARRLRSWRRGGRLRSRAAAARSSGRRCAGSASSSA